MHRQVLRWSLAVWACALLAACGAATRLAYQTADVTLLVTADRYLDFEGEQRRLARESIERIHAWHRKAELPRYAALLDDAAARVGRGLTRPDVEWAIAAVRARYAATVDAAVPYGAPLLASLSARNIAHLEQRFGIEDRKRARTLSGDAAKQERTRVAAIVERVEEWTGRLSAEQHEPIRRFVRATADQPRRAHAHRLRMQRELVSGLDSAVDGAAAPPAAGLHALLLRWEAGRFADRDHQARFVQLVLDLDRTLTAGQRAHAVERLAGYAADCRWLAQRT